MNKVEQITCGILFKHSFRILDTWGKIADYILYDKASLFSTTYFPKISSQYTTERALSNDDTGCSIRLTANNLIYTHTVVNNIDDELQLFQQRLVKSLIPHIIEENNLITQRIGMLYKCQVTSVGMETFASRYFKPEFKNITDFRFSKKESTVSGAIWSDKNDYINKIYTVGRIGDCTMGITFDYQVHYRPNLPSITDRIPRVIAKSYEQLKLEILSAEDIYVK